MSIRVRAPSMPVTVATVVALTMMQVGWTRALGLPKALAPQPLSTALEAFSKETGLQVVYDSPLAQGIESKGAQAGLSAEQALRALLRDTGLTYELVNERTVAIVSAAAPREKIGSLDNSVRMRIARANAVQDEPAGPSPAVAAPEKPALDEIVVTGSHIRGSEIQTAPVTVYTKADIERTGYTTVQQLIEAIPQNFGGDAGGVSEDGRLGTGSAAATNTESATAINLRGLGVGATLVLINGHRVAPSANAAAVDVSVIPLGAIERVEVLTDGSSAIYGSEAIAGVVNFILRDNYEGAETSASYGAPTQGGADERIVSQMAGHSWDSGNVLFGMQYQHRDALSARQRDITSQVPLPTDVLPRRNQTNFLLNVRQELPAGFDVFGQGLYTRLDVDRSNATVGGQYMSAASDSSNRNFSLGVGYAPFGDWRFEVSGLYARQFTDYHGIDSPVGYFGPLVFTRNYELSSVEAKGDGTLFQIPAGAVKLAFGGSYRDESYEVLPSNRRSDRNVSSAYTELSLPLVSASQNVPLVQRLALSAAVRYDDYSDFGNTTNPRFGVMWSPLRGLDFRASYSTSFRAPNANEMDLANRLENRQLVPYPFLAPDGNGTVPVLFVGGALPLQPETSRTWTFGFTYAPEQIRGLKFTLDYYDIDHTNRIAQPPFASNALQNQDVYRSLITSYANDAEVQAAVDAFVASGYTLRDFFALGLSGIRYAYDYRLQNFAKVRQNGFDLGVTYRFDVQANGFEVGLQASRIDEIMTSFGSGTRETDLVDTVANPLALRVRGNLTWLRGPLSVSAAINYTGSYADTTVTPSVPIDDWLTVDLTARLSLDAFSASPVLRNTSLGVSVANLFDRDPPRIVGAGFYPAGYDVANASPLGRFVALSMKKAW